MEGCGLMYCIKCGRETNSERVFCDECLESMEQYPVKPGTSVHLPKKSLPPQEKKGTRKKKPVKPEEQIHLLKSKIKRQRRLIFLLLALLLVASWFLFASTIRNYLSKDDEIQPTTAPITTAPTTTAPATTVPDTSAVPDVSAPDIPE